MGCRLLLGRSLWALSLLASHVVSVALHADAHSAVTDLLNLHLQAAWFADSTSHLGKRFVIRFAPCGSADFVRIMPSLDISGFDIQTDFPCVQRPSAVANMAVRQGFVFRRAGKGIVISTVADTSCPLPNVNAIGVLSAAVHCHLPISCDF